MTVQDRFDKMIDSWLMDGPNRLPEAAIDRIVTEIGRADPGRPSWLPGRKTFSKLALTFAVVAVLAIAVAGIAYLFGSGGIGGGTGYVSQRHSYSIRIPGKWTVNQIPGSWEPGSVFDYLGEGSDQFVDPNDPAIVRLMNSQPVAAGITFDQWVADDDVIQGRWFTNCRYLTHEALTIAGEQARLRTADCTGTHAAPPDVAELVVLHNGRAYAFRVLNDASGSVQDEKALLLDWLKTLRFTSP